MESNYLENKFEYAFSFPPSVISPVACQATFSSKNFGNNKRNASKKSLMTCNYFQFNQNMFMALEMILSTKRFTFQAIEVSSTVLHINADPPWSNRGVISRIVLENTWTRCVLSLGMTCKPSVSISRAEIQWLSRHSDSLKS